MKTKTTLLFLLICAFIKAQSISSITFSNGGEYLSNDTNSINATIGEPIIGYVANGTSLDQGFWASTYSQETLETTPPLKLDTHLNLFPNPVTDILFIKSNLSIDYTVTIFNTDGKKVLESVSIETLESSIDVSVLASGMYLLQIKDQASSFTQSIKFLKR